MPLQYLDEKTALIVRLPDGTTVVGKVKVFLMTNVQHKFKHFAEHLTICDQLCGTKN